jgi:hydrogenase maturation protein HypF
MLSIPADKAYPFRIEENPPVIDVQPMIEAIVVDLQRGVSISIIGGRFHLTIAKMLTAVCQKVYSQTGLRRVALSGGVFQNRLLLKQLSGLLAAQKFNVYTNVQVPANDGGLSLGQAAVAAACL